MSCGRALRPDLASLPQVCVQLTPLSLYEALNDSCIGEAA